MWLTGSGRNELVDHRLARARLWNRSHARLWHRSHYGLWHRSHYGLWHRSHYGLWHHTYARLWHRSHYGLWHRSHCGLWHPSHARLWHPWARCPWGSRRRQARRPQGSLCRCSRRLLLLQLLGADWYPHIVLVLGNDPVDLDEIWVEVFSLIHILAHCRHIWKRLDVVFDLFPPTRPLGEDNIGCHPLNVTVRVPLPLH